MKMSECNVVVWTQELLLSPTQFGIPNSRLRYYLLAKQRPLSFCFETTQEVSTVLHFLLDYHYTVLHMMSSIVFWHCWLASIRSVFSSGQGFL